MVQEGEIYKNNQKLKYQIMERRGSNKHGSRMFSVRFIESGYETIKSVQSIRCGGVRDFLHPSKYGVASLGGENLTSKYPREYTLWDNMLSRCYNDSNSNKDYMSYGGIGVFVDSRWLVFTNFLEDIPRIDGYDHKRFLSGGLELDKDIKQQHIPHSKRVYSLETCVFVNNVTNQKHRDSNKYRRKFIAIDKGGNKYLANGLVDFACEHDLDASSIGRCLDGVYKQHKGWKFKEYNTTNVTTIESK